MILFNQALLTGTESGLLQSVFARREFSGGGEFNNRASDWLKQHVRCREAFLTSSCTAAMEIIAQLLHLHPGDEIIFPAFTHVGTVNPFIKAGVTPVWADIRPDTLNINEQLLPELITSHTRAVVAVHYAGYACEMGTLQDLCRLHNLYLIEDAAQAIGTAYKESPLGSIGDLAVLSFHQTKNIHCGEGGALLINNPAFLSEAQIIRDRGTDRADFDRGRVEKYTWQINGSNYLLSELQAAFLYAQMQHLNQVNRQRKALWNEYHNMLSQFLSPDLLPHPTGECDHNGHCFHLLTENSIERYKLIRYLKAKGVEAVFHYQPLHKAPFWHHGFDSVSLPVTEKVCDTILRLPMHYDLSIDDIRYIANQIKAFYVEIKAKSSGSVAL